MPWLLLMPGFAAALMTPSVKPWTQTDSTRALWAQEARRDPNAIVVTSQRQTEASDWVRLETAHFTLYSANQQVGRAIAIRLETFHQILALVTRTPAINTLPLSVYIVNGTTQIERLRMQRAQPGSIFTGYYSAAPSGIMLAADIFWDTHYAHTESYADGWLFPEYVQHYLMNGGRGENIPDWYMHGLALYFSTIKFDDNSVEYGRVRPSLARWLEKENWEPLSRIISGELNRGQKYSAECALLVHYILADPRRGEAFVRFLAKVREGTPPVAAFEAAFNTSMKRLQTQLWAYRWEAKVIHASLIDVAHSAPTVSRLPKSADTLLLDQAAMRIGIVEPQRQRAVLERAERALTDRGDAFGQRVLAQARILYGDPARADPILAELLRLSPDDAEIAYLAGLRHLIAGRRDPVTTLTEFREARNWFRRAYRLDPDYYPALYGWAETLSVEPTFSSENTLNLLLKGAELAPQVTQFRMTAALLLMYMERYEDAVTLLSPLIISPRNPASEQVPGLLAQAKSRRRPTLEEVVMSFHYVAVWKDLNCC